ncbi:MAG: ompR [Cytophagaceae bacterium]|jgi:DNA-binding response OmpR family regulator|nr:ompR [Cytophagaceae bacterium]
MIYRILVIDDSEDDTFFFKKALADAGIESQLTCLTDGIAGLEALRQETYDCVFLDFQLPGIDGLSILQKIRREGKDMPIVMLTGQKDEQTIVRLMQAGATDYLPKATLSADSLRISIATARKVYLMQKEKSLAEASLKISEARLAEAQHIAAIGNWEQSFLDHSFFLSEEAQRITGNNAGDKMGLLTFCRKIHRQDFHLFTEQIRQLKKNQSYDFNIRFVKGPKDIKCFNIKAYLVAGNKAVGTIQDITELKNAWLTAQKAEIKSKATSIVLVIAVVTFLLSEAILDPFIDQMTASASLLISLSCKGSIAVALKPLEVLLKKIMMSRLAIGV